MRRVVSVSLGSPSRDWSADLTPLGVELTLERRGVGRDYAAYEQALRELDADPEVAAIGLGGINRFLFGGERRYELRRAQELSAAVRSKPVCDGAGLKQEWEPYLIARAAAEGALSLAGRRALMVCAVDRWGMAEALAAEGAEVVFGDLMFALGLPIPIRGWSTLRRLAAALLPVLCRRVPFEWLYPTGESRDIPRYGSWYGWADVLAGDWKFLGRHLPQGPDSLAGKTVITNTTTPADVARLRERGAAVLMTTTPSLGGRSFGTNVVEAAASALTGLPPDRMGLDDYLRVFRPLGWDRPRVERLSGQPAASAAPS